MSNKSDGRRGRGLFLLADWVLIGLSALVAACIVLVLWRGGLRFDLHGTPVGFATATGAVLVLLGLLLSRLLLHALPPGRRRLLPPDSSLLFLLSLGIYLSNGSTLGTGDTLPARFLPMSILRDGDFYLDEAVPLFKAGPLHALRFVEATGKDKPVLGGPALAGRPGVHYVSDYPVGAPVLAVPVYLVSGLGNVTLESPLLEELEKLAGSLMIALSVLVLHLCLKRVTSPTWAALVSVAYAFGTSSLSVSSQALWQHGPAQLCITASLYCLVRGRSELRWMALAGAPLAMAVVCRPTNALLFLPVVVYLLLSYRRCFLPFVAWCLPPVLFQLWYNYTYFHYPLRTQYSGSSVDLWSGEIIPALAGLLLSPGRGLLVYSPIFILSLCGTVAAARRPPDFMVLALGSGALLVIALHSAWKVWWGGLCYGPRLLADITPILAFCMYPVGAVLERRTKVLLPIVVSLLAWSVCAHSIGAFWDDGRWTGYSIPGGLWSWSDNPLVNPPREILNRFLIRYRHLPTSAGSAEYLRAHYEIESAALRGVVGKVPELTLRASNTGPVVWLAWPKAAKGTVSFEWEMLADGKRIGGQGGRIPLRHDVFPGESYELTAPIVLEHPGIYTLRVGLRCEGEFSLEALGIAPAEIPVTIDEPRKPSRRNRQSKREE
ncbi:MAG: glycosyltransferase family 39 protein [Acidobacteriota bacterium]